MKLKTPQEIEKELYKICNTSCRCDTAYSERNLTDPNCTYCEILDDGAILDFIYQIRADDEKAIREDERNKIINMIDGEYIIATDDRQFALHTDGYNNAIEDIIDKLK